MIEYWLYHSFRQIHAHHHKLIVKEQRLSAFTAQTPSNAHVLGTQQRTTPDTKPPKPKNRALQLGPGKTLSFHENLLHAVPKRTSPNIVKNRCIPCKKDEAQILGDTGDSDMDPLKK